LQVAHVQELVAVDGDDHDLQADFAERRVPPDMIQRRLIDRPQPFQRPLAG